MDVATLSQQLAKKAPAPVYLLLGTQQVLQRQARLAFEKLVPPEERVMNVGAYDMEDTPVSVAIDDAMSAPFFGERRLVIINKPYFLTGQRGKTKVEHDVAGLKKYLTNPQPSTVLVFLAPYDKLDGRKAVVKALKKVAVTVDASPLNERAARQAVQELFKAEGVTIAPAALDELVRRTNADYGLMSARVKQLALLAYPQKEVTVEQVAGLVPQSLDDNVFHLVNAVLQRDHRRALDLYHQLIESQTAPLSINAALVNQFRLLIQLKVLAARGLSQAGLAQKLRVHPYRVKLGLQTARHFSLHALTNAFLGLVNVDKQLKTTAQSPELLFQLFILQLSK